MVFPKTKVAKNDHLKKGKIKIFKNKFWPVER